MFKTYKKLKLIIKFMFKDMSNIFVDHMCSFYTQM